MIPGVSDTRPMAAEKKLRSRPSETATIPGAAGKMDIRDKSTEARPSSEPKPMHSRP